MIQGRHAREERGGPARGAGRKRRKGGLAVPEKEILARIASMGYETCRTKRTRPSYYAIKDGSGAVMRVWTAVGTVVPKSDGSKSNTIGIIVHTTAFVPKEHRRPRDHQNHEQGEPPIGKTEVGVDFEPISERFSEYELGSGEVLRIKAAAVRITRSGSFSPDGEPIYSVKTKEIVKSKDGCKCSNCGRILTTGKKDHE